MLLGADIRTTCYSLSHVALLPNFSLVVSGSRSAPTERVKEYCLEREILLWQRDVTALELYSPGLLLEVIGVCG